MIAAICVAAAALAGCSLNDGVGPFIVDPGRYSAFHCKDLVTRLAWLESRQKELRELMDRANDGGGGAVIGQLAYRTDYEKMVGDANVLRRTAAGKKCEVPAPPTPAAPVSATPAAYSAPPAPPAVPTFQSDQIIR